MRTALVGAAIVLGLTASSPAQAQIRVVSADIVIGSGPVVAHIGIGDRHAYRRPVYRVVRAPRVIVVERYHYRTVRRIGHHRHHGWRALRVWYDPHDRRYYDGYRRGLREVTVYEHDGRYYDRYDD